ncbi:MAG: hypothetical protein IJU40_03050, partial [Desulfovibrionaceae bacterium]|nr:hypothetical protein [Desulfovibrionaceae bacterium]
MKNKGLMFLGLILSLPLLWTQIIWAADLIPASPTKVILQMKGGVLEVEEEVLVKTVDGKSTCQILLPNGAQNVRLLVPEHTILSWSQKSFRFKRTNLGTENREKLESQLQEIDIALKLLSQREQLWNVTTNAFTYEDILKIDKQKMEILPSLLKEEKALNKKKQKLLDELKQFKEIESMGSLVTITLADEVQSPKVKVQYNYFLQNCGWRPHYTFAIDPEQGKNEVK